jgi:hypothetical protein
VYSNDNQVFPLSPNQLHMIITSQSKNSTYPKSNRRIHVDHLESDYSEFNKKNSWIDKALVDHIVKTNDSGTNDLTDEPFHYTDERF